MSDFLKLAVFGMPPIALSILVAAWAEKRFGKRGNDRA